LLMIFDDHHPGTSMPSWGHPPHQLASSWRRYRALPTYLHVYEDGRRVWPKAFPDRLLADFRRHFRDEWLPHHSIECFRKPALPMRVFLCPKRSGPSPGIELRPLRGAVACGNFFYNQLTQNPFPLVACFESASGLFRPVPKRGHGMASGRGIQRRGRGV
jgi:hypothetical protein